MSFNSLIFLAFAPIMLLLYWIVPHKVRPYILLVGSYFFYCYLNFFLLFLILSTSLIAYLFALWIEKVKKKNKIILMITVIVILLSILFVFKYLNFTLDLYFSIASLLGKEVDKLVLNIILPVGISFYTFQTLSYVIDVALEKKQAEHNIIIFALFISFFPQLVAGPIEKSENLIPQLKEEHYLNSEDFSYGLQDLIKGYVKKIVVADFLCVFVNQVYGDIASSSGAAILIATFLFGIVIYCDFSGYSDIARGIARMMGIKLMKNFDTPYFSSSIKEFWNRWHISLNNFFVEYVYIPLGGSRKGKFRKCLNIMIVFLLSGIWHGAKLTFVLWGVIHGVIRIVDELIGERKTNNKAIKVLSILGTYILINLVWVFFRANSLQDAFTAFIRIFTSFSNGTGIEFFNKINCFRTISLILIVLLIEKLPRIEIIRKEDGEYDYSKASVVSSLYVVLIFLIALSWLNILSTTGESQFIYFQF